MTTAKTQCIFQSVPDKDLDLLMKVVEKRLPASCFMYNQLKAYSKVKDFSFFSYVNFDETDNGINRDKDENNLWILSRHNREDWGACISISCPVSSLGKPLPSNVASALTQSTYLDWNERFVFICVNAHISEFLVKHNIRTMGNIIKIYPSYLFYMSPEDALQLKTDSQMDSIKLSSLDTDSTQGTNFICNLWPLTKPETTAKYIDKSIQNYWSGGVYVDLPSSENPSSSLVCAAIVPAFGLLSCLLTHPDHRRKGYASLVTKYIYKELATQGYHPCLDAEISSPAAVAFHKSIPGHRILSEVDYICHKALM